MKQQKNLKQLTPEQQRKFNYMLDFIVPSYFDEDSKKWSDVRFTKETIDKMLSYYDVFIEGFEVDQDTRERLIQIDKDNYFMKKPNWYKDIDGQWREWD